MTGKSAGGTSTFTAQLNAMGCREKALSAAAAVGAILLRRYGVARFTLFTSKRRISESGKREQGKGVCDALAWALPQIMCSFNGSKGPKRNLI